MERITLKDIAGYEDEKKELAEIIDAFHRYDEYKSRGAYLPKGLILSGNPGVGKTLFARVLANEIDAPFYHLDGAEISNSGGVRKIKSVFRRARQSCPSVVFIDELNMFVGDRYYRTDRTKRHLSAMLKLIDGISSSDGVLVVGATSDKYALDPALMRSGRMDRHICLNEPDAKSRQAILQYYISAITLSSDNVDIKRIAEKTQGFTSADLKTLVNETALKCIHDGLPLTDELFILNIRKINAQDINRESDGRNLRLAACHDVGHLVVSHVLRGEFDEPTVEFSAEADGNSSIASLFTPSDYDDDDPEVIITKDTLGTVLDKVAILLGGMACEELLLGERYLTSSDDLSSACVLIDKACDGGLFGFEYVNPYRYEYPEISQSLLDKVERKISAVIAEQYERAKLILADNRDVAASVYDALISRKRLSKAQVKELLRVVA